MWAAGKTMEDASNMLRSQGGRGKGVPDLEGCQRRATQGTGRGELRQAGLQAWPLGGACR